MPDAAVAVPAWSVLATAIGVALWVRGERADDVDRERILWLLLGAGGAVVVGGHLLFAADQVHGVVADTVVLTLVLLCGLAVPVTSRSPWWHPARSTCGRRPPGSPRRSS